ncbi:MAG: single-stranded-DNA-specific exonuclease RecJ [Ignavibacterium sp.]|nr:single-stranded-DNA-specific exonuclease RecJ [Ignavibacterium sp.]MCX7612006.1 single-stranded-DNA-specific exonuclease RecJ [Ignavibacterium sp.]MDW8375366.1 single-stranded-DNA-specific exonuclease RecJ [Ignavibacteriales bacterium]
MINKVWKIKETEDTFTIKTLSESLNISETLAKLLVQRGIRTFNQAKNFFRPSIDNLYDPFLMDGMDIATKRVINAIVNNHLIYVYGDYDVDGTCATSLLVLFLKELNANVEFYIPKRLEEGYGISKEGLDFIKSKNASLVIAVDCGITAVEEAEHAKQLGLDLIICDHHQPKEQLPDAIAVLDPIKPQCNYPYKFLSGAGIAFKLAQGISGRVGKRDLPLKYLDLVALAGAADIVPLTGENRILVKEGLDQINKNPRPGIEALIQSAGIQKGSLTSGQIVFTLAPRINAVGRLGDARRAVELLITDNINEAARLAEILESENYERRKIDGDTFDYASSLVENSLDLKKELAIILHQEEWHPGVIGIVASRLVEKYYRPTIMLTTVDGVAKGSARSINNFNIYEALKKCEDVLLHFGGHKAAAGLAIELDKIEEFRLRFNQIVRESLSEEDLIPEIEIDTEVKFSEITPKFLRIIEQFSPFGPGNMRPVFLTRGVNVLNTPRVVGNNHLYVTFKHKTNQKVIDSIGFNLGEYLDLLKENKNSEFDIVYVIDKFEKDGRIFPQLRLRDLRISQTLNSQENK